jgi:Actin like proteins N terminal domain
MVISRERAGAANLAENARSGKSATVIPVGVDIGNGALKLASGAGEKRLESYVFYLPAREAMGMKMGYVEYHQGDRTDLIDKQWVGGINAYYVGLISGMYRVTDSKLGKADLGLQLLLSGLSTLPYRTEWNLHLACSVHDGKTLAAPLRAALEGTHIVVMNGRKSSVFITVGAVLEEGVGAVIHYQKQCDTTNVLLYDLGNGTLIVSGFSGLKITDRRYSQNGVESLIDSIATNDQVRKQLLKEGDRHLIRAGIEKGDFSYGTQYPGWNFKDAYITELPLWVERVIKPMVRSTEERMDSATALIAIGGGGSLPGIGTLLAKRNIKVLPDPQWANARGLYAYALRKASSLEE